MKNPGIYILANKVNGKQYVGCSSDVPYRVNWHLNLYSTSSPAIHKAIKKYGRDAFDVEIIPYPGISDEALNAVEIWKIKQLNTISPNGYNLTKGGEGVTGLNIGKKFSKEHRIKISKANSGENNPFYGKSHAPETRKKMSENSAVKGKSLPPETLKKISDALSGEKHPMYGRSHSDTAIEKMSIPQQEVDHIRYLYKNGLYLYVIASIVGVDVTTVRKYTKILRPSNFHHPSALTENQINRIVYLHQVEHFSIRQISRITGFSRKSIRKYAKNLPSPHRVHLTSNQICHIHYLYRIGIRPNKLIASIVGVSRRTVDRHIKKLSTS